MADRLFPKPSIYLITKRVIVKVVIDYACNDIEHLKGEENHETGDSLTNEQKNGA
jgi:hypothetical protein